MLCRIYWNSTEGNCLSFSGKLCAFDYCIFGEHFDPSCPSQGEFTSPTVQLLYRNLAITELCVGLIVEPLAVRYWISVVNEVWDICYYADLLGGFLGYTLYAVSFFTPTVISVDRLLQGHPTRI